MGEDPVSRRCPGCGRPRPASVPCASPWCERPDRGWAWVSAAGAYRGRLRADLLSYKREGDRRMADRLGGLLARELADTAGWWEEWDLLVAVPAYRGFGARRSWDAVRGLLLAAAAQVGPGWEVLPGAVVKLGETPPLAGLDGPGRRRAAASRLRPALSVPDPSAVRGRRVVVVDDVFTEGSTLREVAMALRRAGASEVAGLVVAAAEWGGGRKRG